jgi:hypothetical protein
VKLESALVTAGVLVMTMSTASSVSAQVIRHAADVSIGYQVLHIPDETFPFGINVDAAGFVRPGLKVVGEFGWARDSQSEAGVTGTLNFVNLDGGVRWSLARATMGNGDRSVEPYVQMMLGAVHAGANLNVGGNAVDNGNWAFMLQPGAGVAVPLTPVVAAIGQVDYRRAFFDSGENEVRFVFGIRFGPR